MGNLMSAGGSQTATGDGMAADGFISRLSNEELKRFTDGYRRICRVEGGDASSSSSQSSPAFPHGTSVSNSVNATNGASDTTSGPLLTKKSFRAKVLSTFPMIPHALSDRLFDVLDSGHVGGLRLVNLLSGLAWLKHGTYEEQVHLLFIIYDVNNTREISREGLDIFMDVIYGRRRARSTATIKFLDRIFNGRTTLNLHEFRQIIQVKDEHGDALLVKWLAILAAKIGNDDDPQVIALEKTYNPVAIRRRIAQATLFSLTEVTALERQFQKLFDPKGGASTRIPSSQFIEVLSANGLLPKELLERFCASTAMPDIVLFEEFCLFLSDFCRGPSSNDKMHHLFHIYSNRNTTVTVDFGSMKELIHTGMKCSPGCTDVEVNEEEERQVEEVDVTLLVDIMRHGELTHFHVGVEMQISASQTVETGWDQEAFIKWAEEAIAIRRILHQLEFAACILFDLKPETPGLEKRIVTWHWLEATRSFSVGQTWNLLGAEWWRKWCDYVGLDPRNGSPYGSLPIPHMPPNIVVEKATNIRGDVACRTVSFDNVANCSRSHRPGPITSWKLLMQSGCRRLKQNLVLARDFYIIPSSVYALLFSWYSGGPDLVRSIVEASTSTEPELQIELFPLVLRVARVDPANGNVVRSGEEIVLSELSTPASLLEATCRALLLAKLIDKARLWYFNETTPDRKIRLRDDNPHELKKLTQDSVFLLEVQDDDGSWPISQSEDSTSSYSTDPITQANSRVEDDEAGAASRKRQREHRPSVFTSDICSRGNLGEVLTQRGPGSDDVVQTEEDPMLASSVVRKRFSKDAFKGPGLVGLDNLGNTCYMSSALQCLSHTRLLAEYFKNEAYLRDINFRNRDGTNGKLTAAFGELLQVLWSSDRKRFAPLEFKKVLANCNPQFAGSNQHDAQELLACLLSSLSEDLNRVVKKPYTEQPDSDGRPDALVADEWWQNHQKREYSVVVALFTGQYKSLLECSVCQYESARFEPFTFLQLSLPESNARSIVLTIIFCTDRVPLRFSVRVRHGDTVQQIKEQIAEFLRTTKNEVSVFYSTQGTSASMTKTNDVRTEVIIARTSVLHIVESLLDDKLPLTQIHERDQLSAFQLDGEEDLLLPRQAVESTQASTTSVVEVSNETTSDKYTSTKEVTSKHAIEDDTELANGSSTNGSLCLDTIKGDTNASNGDHSIALEAADNNIGQDGEVLPYGTSVYIRIDKTKQMLPARVIGSSLNSRTINVAYSSGARRYHIPISKVIERRESHAFIFFVHRRVERSTDSFTNAHITRLFGIPLIIRVSLRDTSTYTLYLLVWNRLRRIFNWQTPPRLSDCDEEYDGKEIRSNVSSLALGKHLPLTKFGFCLRLVTSHGTGCSRCEWLDGCLGCMLVPSSRTVIPLAAEETVAIDWDIRTLKEEYDPIQASKMDVDVSVQQHQRQDNQPLNLAHCMEMFTAKETISEAYCGHCKTLRPATKKMDLWRLPPLLVIHLKRFRFTQVSRRKLHHLVDFPLKGLQFKEFVAWMREPSHEQAGLEYWLFLGGKLVESKSSGSPRPVSMSALEAPAVTAAAGQGDDSCVYDLYAVVNHVGALGGGHYFAYVLSEHDGKWKCFNDHQCKDIDEQEVVSSMAYILFYRRRDTTQMSIEELFPPLPVDTTGDGTTTEAQVEELLQQSKLPTSSTASNCTIS